MSSNNRSTWSLFGRHSASQYIDFPLEQKNSASAGFSSTSSHVHPGTSPSPRSPLALADPLPVPSWVKLPAPLADALAVEEFILSPLEIELPPLPVPDVLNPKDPKPLPEADTSRPEADPNAEPPPDAPDDIEPVPLPNPEAEEAEEA